MQFYKGDATEQKYYASGEGILDLIGIQLDDFLQGAYSCYPLGDMIWDTGRSPLANAIPRSIFRESFPELFESFRAAGTFEAYISVFKKIFGDDVVIDFTVPAPGKLNIDIEATGVELSNFVARRIVTGAYVFDEVVDDEDDNIVFQTVKGFQSEYELNQMLKEMVPAGIYTEISLTVG